MKYVNLSLSYAGETWTDSGAGGSWVGWTGGRRSTSLPSDLGYELHGVDLGQELTRGYYDGFSNATLWPLYHNLVRTPVFNRDWWRHYARVNCEFADVVSRTAKPESAVWIHDYHLQLVPTLLRERRPDLRIGFFLHIPFPATDLFMSLPWRRQIIDGISGAHVIGFQTPRDVDNFRQCAVNVGRLSGEPESVTQQLNILSDIRAFPISVDWNHWESLACSSSVSERAAELRRQLGSPRHLLVGVDRLDYTKGIEQRLVAFAELMRDGSVRAPDTVMVQVAVPSRDRTAAYRNERRRIEELVGRINGTYGQVGAPAVHYVHRSLDADEIAALYFAADVMVVTPVQDGMNLVAKEFVASRMKTDGVLVLSEFAGAAHELTEAVLVNPHDTDGLKDSLMTAISMSKLEAERRMQSLRQVVAGNTVHDWASQFLARLMPALQHDAHSMS